ncbi:MAG TPA: helix-turn-helix transcriptional regulator [Terriglobales bacterium]|nr:helix-turn-helix transcriptional regulator [Terriglobales bacterium]
MIAGEKLRALREKLGFTLKDVEEASWKLVAQRNNPRYCIPQSGLSHIESKGITPNIYKLETLAMIYKRPISELLEWYGIGQLKGECAAKAPKTHLLSELQEQACALPLRLDPLFDERKTSYIRRMIQEWGSRPIAALESLPQRQFTYGYVGTEDYTLFPMILPGAFIQVDPKLTEIETGPWASDFERPIYFLETRDSYICGWCALISSREIQVQAHPLSGLPARNYRLPAEIEVVGRVVGIAMKLRSATRDSEQENAAIAAQI